MSVLGLSFPTDIPWERMCVSEDMIAQDPCGNLPPKFYSSIAVFKYVPDASYQIYPGRKITYLKIVCSLSGYEAPQDEIQGNLDFNQLTTSQIDNVNDMLGSYLGCTGAIVQIAVSTDLALPLSQYPYIMDFQPKKRELYEMATDTGERMSRSLESINVNKSAGSTNSNEVLDIDQGGSQNLGVNASVGGTGGGITEGSSTSGQWGTKSMGSQDSSVDRSRDESSEKREDFSHTTQISQLYHQLDSYHQGTNRIMFYISPRPHILDIPTGFVDGPRELEGIQEFFLIVNQADDGNNLAVSVRLDTAHLVQNEIYDYDRTQTDLFPPDGPVDVENNRPTQQDTDTVAASSETVDGGFPVFNVGYNCVSRTKTADQSYTPPTLNGYPYLIDTGQGYTDLVNDVLNGSSSVTNFSPNLATIHCEATSHACFKPNNDTANGILATIIAAAALGGPAALVMAGWFWGTWGNMPNQTDAYPSHAKRQIAFHLISQDKIIDTHQVQQSLLITTRGLCCGIMIAHPVVTVPKLVQTINLGSIPTVSLLTHPNLTNPNLTNPNLTNPNLTNPNLTNPSSNSESVLSNKKMSVKHANMLRDKIRRAMINSQSSQRRDKTETLTVFDLTIFVDKVLTKMRQTHEGRILLQRPCTECLDKKTAKRISHLVKKEAKKITCLTLAELPITTFMALTKLDEPSANRLRLLLLGFPIKKRLEKKPKMKKRSLGK